MLEKCLQGRQRQCQQLLSKKSAIFTQNFTNLHGETYKHILESNLRLFSSESLGLKGQRKNKLKQEEHRKKQFMERHYFDNVKTRWENKEELIEKIIASKLYEDDTLVVFNKPYGLPMRSLRTPASKSQKDNLQNIRDALHEYEYQALAPGHLAMEDIVPLLQKEVYTSPSFRLMYGQEREMSGPIVFAKTTDAYNILQKYFVHMRTQKQHFQTYWAVTVGIPHTPEGQCDVYLQQAKCNGRMLSVEVDVNQMRHKRKRGQVKSSHVQHTVVAQHHSSNDVGAALVEIKPSLKTWDVLQFFLLSQLSPVLGDHLYSSRCKSVLGKPYLVDARTAWQSLQDLPFGLSRRLGLDSSQPHFVPLHLHCHQLQLPRISGKKGTQLTVTAPPPDFFSETLTILNLHPQIDDDGK